MSEGLDKLLRENSEYIRARYGSDQAAAARAAWTEPGWYGRGGYIPGRPAPAPISADECLISASDVHGGRIRCSRAGHPTPTSDCGRPNAQIEPPEASA